MQNNETIHIKIDTRDFQALMELANRTPKTTAEVIALELIATKANAQIKAIAAKQKPGNDLHQ